MISRVAIVSLNWNGLKHLKYFLPTVRRIDYDNYFTIVVDNGSIDGSVDYITANFPEIKVIELCQNIGYSKGFNKGIEHAINLGAEYILITNNDVKLDCDILKEGVHLARSDRKIGYMSGKIYNLNQKNTFQFAGGRVLHGSRNVLPHRQYQRGSGEKDIGQYEEVEDFDYMDDVCVLASSVMIKEIGAYDEDFFFDFEETEWNIRIRRNGYRIVYNPKMIAWHRVHGSTGGTRYTAIPEYYHWKGKVIFNMKVNKGLGFVYASMVILFKEMPLHWGVLIKRKHTCLIYHNLRGVISGFKRVVELKGDI